MIDSSYSSVCEIIYDFLVRSQFKISGKIATFMVVGILGDTGSFEHSNTTPQVLEIASDLMRKGADIFKITKIVFANKKMSTLKLWGKAFEKARINSKSGMIVTALTKKDLEEGRQFN